MIEYSEYDIKNAERLRIRFKIINFIGDVMSIRSKYLFIDYDYIKLSKYAQLLKDFDVKKITLNEEELENELKIILLKLKRLAKLKLTNK